MKMTIRHVTTCHYTLLPDDCKQFTHYFFKVHIFFRFIFIDLKKGELSYIKKLAGINLKIQGHYPLVF